MSPSSLKQASLNRDMSGGSTLILCALRLRHILCFVLVLWCITFFFSFCAATTKSKTGVFKTAAHSNFGKSARGYFNLQYDNNREDNRAVPFNARQRKSAGFFLIHDVLFCLLHNIESTVRTTTDLFPYSIFFLAGEPLYPWLAASLFFFSRSIKKINGFLLSVLCCYYMYTVQYKSLLLPPYSTVVLQPSCH